MFALIAAVAVGSGPVFRTSQVDVTPNELLPLGGYTSRGDKKMESGGERLYARTLVIEDGGAKVAIVSFESLTVPESLYQAVKTALPSDVELFLVATHTHSAPDSQMLNERMTFKIPGIASFNRRWLDWYAGKIASGVQMALAAEAHDATQIKVSEADVLANHGRRKDAQPITRATYLSFEGKPLLTCYSAHGTVQEDTNLKTSGDWLGLAAGELGGLVLPGAIGDAAPNLVGKDAVENMADIVDKLSAGYKKSMAKPLVLTEPLLRVSHEAIRLNKPVPHPDFSKSFGAPAPLDQVLIDRFAPREAEVTVVKVGSVLMVGIPGEPTSELGRLVQVFGSSLGFPHAFVVSHTNGWIGYILTGEDYDRGGYEATLSFHGRETAERVIEAAKKAMATATAVQDLPRVAQVR